MSSGALVPFPAAGLPAELASQALGWRAVDPWEPLALLLPARLRREHGAALAAGGWVAHGEPRSLPERAFGVPAHRLAALREAGPLLLFRRHPAWRALGGVSPGAALEAAEREIGGLAGRIARERDLLAVGDLLQTCPAPAGGGAARWVRFSVLRLHGDPGPLLALLRGDREEPGITPLAELALGAALGERFAPAWSDPALERWLAARCLEAPGPAGAGTAAAPLALPALEPPAAVQAVLAGLEAAARGEPAPATGLALEARLRDVAATRRGEPEAAARLGQGALDPELLLALAVEHALAGLEPARRRSLWRRLAPGGAPAVEELLADLGGLERLVQTGADPAALQARLAELEAEPPELVAGERERTRTALAGLAAPRRAGLGQLELWLAAGRPEAPDLALEVLRGAVATGADPFDPVVTTALRVLAEAGRAPAPAQARGRDLGLLLRWHLLRPGDEPLPEALLLRLVQPGAHGLAPGPDAGQLDPHLLAEALGRELTADAALAVLAAALPPSGALRLLLLRGGAGACEAILAEPGAAPRAVAAWPNGPLEALQALEGRLHPALELPEAVVSAVLPGAGAVRCLIGRRLGGVPLGEDPRRGPALCRLVAAAHALGLALLDDPRRAARILPQGGLGLTGLDLRAAIDAAHRERAQARDRAGLRALAAAWGGRDPSGDDPGALAAQLEALLGAQGPAAPDLADPRQAARAFLGDVLPGRGPLQPAAVLELLPPRLRALLDGPEPARELLRDLREEGWAGGPFRVAFQAGAVVVEPAEVTS